MAQPNVVPLLPILSHSQDMSLRVMSVMGRTYGALPTAFWNLSHRADLVAPRGFVVKSRDSLVRYDLRFAQGHVARYPIVSLKVIWWPQGQPLAVLPGVKKLIVEYTQFQGDFVWNEEIEALIFHFKSHFNRHIDLPNGLKKVAFGM